jgi:hypothetical protein
MAFEIDGVFYRVLHGRKGPGDLRLEHRVDGAWKPVRMRTGAMLADFFFENEEVLYPDAKGGKKYLEYVRDATKYGWDKADAVLRVERAQRKVQRSLFDEDGAA